MKEGPSGPSFRVPGPPGAGELVAAGREDHDKRALVGAGLDTSARPAAKER